MYKLRIMRPYLTGLTLFTILYFCFALPLLAVPQYLATVSQDTLFLSSDNGTSWSNLAILKGLNKTTYLISVARNQAKPEQIALGTSFEGIYESLDSGKTWKKIEALKTFRPFFQGSGFYEEVVALQYADDGSNDLFFRLGFNGKAYRLVRVKKAIFEIDLSRTEFANLNPAFGFSLDSNNNNPQWTYTLPPQSSEIPLPPEFNKPEPDLGGIDPSTDPERARRRELAANKFGLYLNPNQASGTKLAKQLDFVVKNKLNSIVVDFKDEYGRLTYDSQIPLAKEMKSPLKRIDPPALIKAAHDKGLYVIGRIVVFKDRVLYAYQKNSYAIWNKSTNKPWGVFRQETVKSNKEGEPDTKQWNQIEHWVDPYSDFVHQYAIAIAKEAQDFGVDEIQFDYIRFPSDGETSQILCRFNKDEQGNIIKVESSGSDRVKALTVFLKKAREALTVPIGTDVYGFNGWARMSYLGQDIQAFSYYVDVISPMMYPSHYALDFLSPMRYFDRASYIYEVGTQRSRMITGNRSLIRPYVQAFLIGTETRWEDPQFIDYLNRQVSSSIKGGASGLTMWNNLGNYYMVDPQTFPKLIPEQTR